MRIAKNGSMPNWLSRAAEDLENKPNITNGDEKKDRGTYSFGECPDEVVYKAAIEQCPNGYHMEIKSQDEWKTIADAVNIGIDGHLEAFTRSSFDCKTGSCNVHPQELPTLLRRLYESESEEGWSLRTDILSTLGIEEV